jgi:hypothetical protein
MAAGAARGQNYRFCNWARHDSSDPGQPANVEALRSLTDYIDTTSRRRILVDVLTPS